mgnify:CR=1 FL=1
MRTSKTVALLDAYSYPRPIIDCIEGVVTWLERQLPVSRLILLGSTARGELSWYRLGDEVDVLSDLEFYLITERTLRASEAHALSAAKADWQRTWSFPNPFFHIDISMNPEAVFWRKIRFDRRIATFELLSTGRVLIGEDFERDPLLFGVNGLDLGNTNELVLVRLWMQLLFTPIRVVSGTAHDYEWLVLRFALCRNLLEILTIFLPNVGILLPSYRQREQHFRNHAELHSHLASDAAQVQAACLEAKLRLHIPEPWSFYYEQFLRQYLGLLAFLTGAPVGATRSLLGDVDEVCGHVLASRGCFMVDHWLPRIRRRRREIRLLGRYARSEGPSVAVRWFRQPRRPLVLCFLLYMHYALYEILQTGQTSVFPRVTDILTSLHPAFPGVMPAGTSAEQWLYLRRTFMDFMSWWQYNDIGYLERWGIMEWEYEGR